MLNIIYEGAQREGCGEEQMVAEEAEDSVEGLQRLVKVCHGDGDLRSNLGRRELSAGGPDSASMLNTLSSMAALKAI